MELFFNGRECSLALRPSYIYFFFLIIFGTVSSLFAQPQGFVDQQISTGWSQATGLTFDNTGRMFVWEKRGRVYLAENGVKGQPLIDISQEVGAWRDHGLLSVALDPNFLTNGYIYLLYVVDRHHLLNFGTPSYNPSSNLYFAATIGRLTRYTLDKSTNFTSVDYSTRKILLGATKESGFPSLHETHGAGDLLFGSDGSLIVSIGDGASFVSVDEGSDPTSYFDQALDDGIISPEENVGAYRSQLLSSLSGKILRIDPETGLGLSSNPYYDPEDPNSATSKIWALGARNPYRIALKPGTGSHFKQEGNPGVFYFGDVGWETREELNVISAPAQNFGWPKYEGMTFEPGYNNSSFEPDNHTLPVVDWRTGSARAYKDGVIYDNTSGQISGLDFIGNCSTGGVWYTGDDFPAEYKNTYFHADYGAKWIYNFRFNENNELIEVNQFDDSNGSVVYLATNPITGGLYYVRYGSAIHKFSYQSSGNQPPTAIASADKQYGPGPLTVQFTGEQSIDPENEDLSYEWDFGNGPESTEVNPSYTFTTSSNEPTTFSVRLTVRDSEGLIDETTLDISLNNTPPKIVSTSLDNINNYSLASTSSIDLSANITDSEHDVSELQFEWQTFLHHDNHNHPEAIDNELITSTLISPVGCDGILYYYRIVLKATDPGGLSSSFEKNIYPDCGGPLAENDIGTMPAKTKSVSLNILANDKGNLDAASVEILSLPLFGTVQVDASSGVVTYTANQDNKEDMFTYLVRDVSGNVSNVAGVSIAEPQPPIINNPGDQTYFEGDLVNLQLVATDLNNADLLTFSQQGLPASLTIDQSTGLVSGIATAPGDYIVTIRVTDEVGLFNEQNFTLRIQGLKEISFQDEVVDASCKGDDGSISLTFSEIDPQLLDISWSNGTNGTAIDNLIPGSYTVTISGPGYKTTTRTFTVNLNQQIEEPTIERVGNLLVASDAAGYQWYLDQQLMVGETGQTLELAEPGNYSVTTTNDKGCTYSSDAINIEKVFKNGTVIYPNPTDGELNIENSYKDQQTIVYQLIDQSGKLVLSGEKIVGPGLSKITIDLIQNRISDGAYVFKLKSKDEGIRIEKITLLK